MQDVISLAPFTSLTGKKNVVVDNVSCLDIHVDDHKIQEEEEALALLSD
jgi:hypothetical protein